MLQGFDGPDRELQDGRDLCVGVSLQVLEDDHRTLHWRELLEGGRSLLPQDGAVNLRLYIALCRNEPLIQRVVIAVHLPPRVIDDQIVSHPVEPGFQVLPGPVAL